MEFLTKHENNKVVMALGFFDSLHIAHRKIIFQTKEIATKKGYLSAILTFNNNIKSRPLIYTIEERLNMLDEMQMDKLLSFDFTPAFAAISPEKFIVSLIEDYRVGAFVCGYDYHFGKNAIGDVALLAEICSKRGVGLEVVEKQTVDGQAVSSSYIKDLLENGDIEKANSLLLAPYHISEYVVFGRGEGRTFGFPTANFPQILGKIMPKCGVYGTMCDINGQKYKAVTNVGSKPTFGDNSFSIETFIDNFSGDLYGKKITLSFLKGIRDIRKFDNKDKLREQIYLDRRW